MSNLSQVTARFYVAELTKFAFSQIRVKLQPAYSKKHNAKWAAATPSGSIEMNISADMPAAAWFEEALANKSDIAITFEISEDPRDDH